MTKFLNISTDTTLGGNSPSDETVSSQKAIKSYVDSQTGTAPAFANITGQPTDNANLAAALDKKENIPYISLYNGSSGNPRPIKFLTVDYTNTNSENGVFIKITMQSSHGNGVSYAFLQDAFFNINYTGTISCEVFKYFGATTSYDGSRQYGDIFWVHDSENKIVDFYTLMGQFSALYSTPYRRLNTSTGGEITQLTTTSTYSEGTQVWASCGDYYTTADPVLTNLTTNATSLTIKGTPISPSCGNSINIGYGSSVGDNGEVCIGVGASTRQIASTAIGFYASATKTNAIQIGTGTNSTANTFYVGFRNEDNYLLLDGATGLIPNARLNTLVGADGINAGTAGIVPAPSATDNTKYLRGDGTWGAIMVIEDYTA